MQQAAMVYSEVVYTKSMSHQSRAAEGRWERRERWELPPYPPIYLSPNKIFKVDKKIKPFLKILVV